MNILRRRILTAGLALACAGLAQGKTQLAKLETLTGKVRVQAERGGPKLTLTGEDGKTREVVRDAGSRMFLKDEKLLNRPMRLTGRMQASGAFQVVEVQSLIKGVPHDVYYWCDVCSIRRYEKMICECCGGPMDLKETPVNK